jgi:beta-glucosidase-like glycosyl hydrolase
VDLAAIAQTVAVVAALAGMTPEQKAAAVVVSGLPAPPGVGGVIIMGDDLDLEWPDGPIVFTDQEGEGVKRFADLPPFHPASWYRKTADAFLAGRATGRALRRVGVDVDLAPVLDSPDGPLGSRHFRRPALGLAFARGLAAGGAGACAKHFPGLGSAAISTDDRPHVDATVREDEVAAFRAAIAAGVPCVMTSNAFYDGRRFRASIDRSAYGLLRSLGFGGVAITDSLSVVRKAPIERWAPQAIRAGADLVLFTSPEHARRAIRALVPLAKTGALDLHVARVLRFERALAR